ncbi:MAG: Asp-tRNA(Asn)/Glu-tRNA(Gln) amidotransferase subunit GatC [Bacillota bacterium]|nr:Asp-tRNA(Asn)/Glu-tRNA(Gln) amidotransferase subunit GatC [Bacillota bacterium]
MNEKTALISLDDVDYIARLAHLHFSEEEKLDCQNKLASILEYMQQLRMIDTRDVEPTTHVFPMTNVFREDIIQPGLSREEALANAAEHTADSFKVPKIL